MYTYIAKRVLLWAGASSWSLGLSPGLPWVRSQAGSEPGPRPGPGSSGLGPGLRETGPAHVHALLAIYIYIFYGNLHHFLPRYNTLFQIRCP